MVNIIINLIKAYHNISSIINYKLVVLAILLYTT